MCRGDKMNKIEQYVKWFNDEHNVQIQRTNTMYITL